MPAPHDSLTSQLLAWIDEAPRAYWEVLEVWKSSCPRLTIWEDACAEGLVGSGAGRTGIVFLTEKGRTFLAKSGAAQAS